MRGNVETERDAIASASGLRRARRRARGHAERRRGGAAGRRLSRLLVTLKSAGGTAAGPPGRRPPAAGRSQQHVHAAAAPHQARRALGRARAGRRAARPAQHVEGDRHDLLPEVGLEPAHRAPRRQSAGRPAGAGGRGPGEGSTHSEAMLTCGGSPTAFCTTRNSLVASSSTWHVRSTTSPRRRHAPSPCAQRAY